MAEESKKYLDLVGLQRYNDALQQQHSVLRTGIESAQTTANTALSKACNCSESSMNMSTDYKKAQLSYYDYIKSKDSNASSYIDEIRNAILEMEEFKKLGTGLFIHWGIYSVPAGHYDGAKQPGSTVTTTDISYNCEWGMRDLAIPAETYKSYEAQFTGAAFDADAIAQKAVDLGMKYIIITAKHHDGFCLAPTSNANWDIRTSACRPTILDELKTACVAHDLKFCMYYSQYWDWMAEGGFGLNHGSKYTSTDPYTQAQHIAYCNNAVNQIKELVDKYDPYILWYDPGTSYSTTYSDIFKTAESKFYPHVIKNDRLLYNRSTGDYGTGERTIYLRTLPYGESCFTLNDTWGYSVNNENKYFTLEKVLKQFLLYTVSYGQNCVLNVGPKPDGSLTDNTLTILNKLKDFIDDYANGGFYNYTRMNIKSRPKWGYAIGFPDNKVMCYIITPNNQNYSSIILDGIDTTMLKTDGVHILTAGANPSYTILDNYRIQIDGLALDAQSKIGVVELEYLATPTITDVFTTKLNEENTTRVFPVNSTTASSYNFTRHQLENLAISSAYSGSSRMLWNDETNDCTVEISCTYPTEGTVDSTITLKFTDEADSTKTITLTYQNGVCTTNDTFNFQKGHIYTVDFSTNGSTTSKFTLNYFKMVTNTPVEPEEPETVVPTSITLNKTSVVFGDVGQTEQLTATVLPENAEDRNVTWASDDTTIATVDNNGLVTAAALGSCHITATTSNAISASCDITVSQVHPDGITLSESAITLIQAQKSTLVATVSPESAPNKNVIWSTSDATVATVVDGVVTAQDEANGTATITATTEDGNISTTCIITVVPEVTDYLFEALSLDGSESQGEDTGITLFSDANQNWTLFGFVQNSVNPSSIATGSSTPDKNATLYQCVVNSSPWTGIRVDANSNAVAPTASVPAPMRFRFLAGTDNYVNATTGEVMGNSIVENATTPKHPICLSRNGSTYKFSADGINWTEFVGLTTSQLNRLKDCVLTVGFDYRRSGGNITTNKYRMLKTNDPCCVAITYQSEYPFPKLYKKYDVSRD